MNSPISGCRHLRRPRCRAQSCVRSIRRSGLSASRRCPSPPRRAASVLAATTYSKSVLRAVAGENGCAHDGGGLFPLLRDHPGALRRSLFQGKPAPVTREGVDTACGLLRRAGRAHRGDRLWAALPTISPRSIPTMTRRLRRGHAGGIQRIMSSASSETRMSACCAPPRNLRARRPRATFSPGRRAIEATIGAVITTARSGCAAPGRFDMPSDSMSPLCDGPRRHHLDLQRARHPRDHRVSGWPSAALPLDQPADKPLVSEATFTAASPTSPATA